MKRQIRNLIRKILFTMAGKKKYQLIFELVNQLSLEGMNIGCGADYANSGERKVLEYINDKFHSENNLVIFDVGANVGHYSILAEEVFGEKANINSFEPSLKTFQRLKSNIKNTSKNNQYNFGFGNENVKVALYSNSEGSGLASVYKRRLDHFKIDMSMIEDIQLKTLDTFCQDRNIKHIHLLKLDVEGNEINVLNGASKMINEGNIDFIQFEFGGCNIDSRTYFQDFYYALKDKYRIYRVVKDGLYEISHYKESYEVFLTTNFLAERI